jgi:hypothetical protein
VLSTGEQDVWVVDASGSDRIARAAVAADQPVLVRARPDDAQAWYWASLAAARVDVVSVSAGPHELVARIHGLMARAGSWSPVCARLCTTAAHDLRSPLQGLRSTLTNLAHEGMLQGEMAESFGMLEAVADAFELQLHGLYNLGRRLSVDRRDVLDLAAALGEELGRPMFKRVDADLVGALPVQGHAGDLRYALLDLLRVAVQMTASSKRIRLVGRREGHKASITLDAPVYAAISAHAAATLRREGALLLRPNVRLPLAGVSFVADIARACGGTFEVTVPEPTRVVFHLRLPLAQEAAA